MLDKMTKNKIFQKFAKFLEHENPNSIYFIFHFVFRLNESPGSTQFFLVSSIKLLGICEECVHILQMCYSFTTSTPLTCKQQFALHSKKFRLFFWQLSLLSQHLINFLQEISNRFSVVLAALKPTILLRLFTTTYQHNSSTYQSVM